MGRFLAASLTEARLLRISSGRFPKKLTPAPLALWVLATSYIAIGPVSAHCVLGDALRNRFFCSIRPNTLRRAGPRGANGRWRHRTLAPRGPLAPEGPVLTLQDVGSVYTLGASRPGVCPFHLVFSALGGRTVRIADASKLDLSPGVFLRPRFGETRFLIVGRRWRHRPQSQILKKENVVCLPNEFETSRFAST